MSVESMFTRIRVILAEHNAAIGGAGQPGFVEPSDFESCIKMMGGTNEDRLKRMSYEDILQCLPHSQTKTGVKITPTPLAKDIAAIFRGKDEENETRRPVIGLRAERMTIEELVKAFDPEESTNAVAKRLKEISRGEPFVVFSEGRIVDVVTTTELLKEVKAAYPGRTKIQIGNQIKAVYKIGSLPDAMADENPLYPGRVLRPDGTCDQTGRSWRGIPLGVRQFIRVAVSIGDIKVTMEAAHSVLDLIMNPNFDEISKLSERYQNAAIEFDRLSKSGGLPKMVIPMGGNGASPQVKLNNGNKVIMG